jgi:hypothetical protein
MLHTTNSASPKHNRFCQHCDESSRLKTPWRPHGEGLFKQFAPTSEQQSGAVPEDDVTTAGLGFGVSEVWVVA